MRAGSIVAWWRTRRWLEKSAAIALVALLAVYAAGIRSGLAVGVLEAAALLLGGAVAIRYLRSWLLAFMWRLRHRLIITYVFIAVVPVLLLVLMAGLAAYIFYGQVATYLVDNNLARVQEQVLMAAEATAKDAAASSSLPSAAEAFRTHLPADLAGMHFEVTSVRERPAWMNEDFHGLVEAYGGPAFRTAVPVKSGMLVVNVAVSGELLEQIARGIGTIDFLNTTLQEGPSSGQTPQLLGRGISGGSLAAPVNRLDHDVWGILALQQYDWQTGEKTGTAGLLVTSRPSLLNTRLFAIPSIFPNAPLTALAVVGFVFFLIEILSLFVGVRLTRTVTRAVADLYEGTQRVHQGNFVYRIPVRSNDQLAALSASFNTMTASLENLIREQKEKQRMQSELEIARDVQAQLFPKQLPSMQRLEVAALCNPARTVSGDYYDFLEADAQRLGLVLADIAGKGISAALLMASIQSMLHAQFSLFHEQAAAENSPARVPAQAAYNTQALVAQLNRQLHQNIAVGHFATFFGAFYNDATGDLTYTNAGHLPPIILRKGRILRLEKGGMVLGIFPHAMYEQETVRLERGDLLVGYTDGITEPENSYGEEFGEQRLLDLLKHSAHLPPAEIIGAVMAAVREWTASPEQPDDMTLLVARRR